MRNLLIAVLVMVGIMFAHALKEEDTSNRPLFNQGTVKIQLKESVMTSKDFQVKEFGKEYVQTGISSLDEIAIKIKAVNPRVTHIDAKNKELAKKLGLDRWIT
ncbi:MAG: hypothetical protein JXR69_07990, partial [Candidatus Delongbacteria bacterium]|nr:hypothetical protein [Candidatus Delongbacteria bacterium]